MIKKFIVLQIKYNHYTPTIQANDSVKVVYDIKSKCINSILVKNNKNLWYLRAVERNEKQKDGQLYI